MKGMRTIAGYPLCFGTVQNPTPAPTEKNGWAP